MEEIYRFLVTPDRNVLEIGCATGDLLASLNPRMGVGIDLSGQMLKRASARHPGLKFIQCDAQDLCLHGRFDIIILSDLVNDLWDVQAVFEQVGRLSTPRTRAILNIQQIVGTAPGAGETPPSRQDDAPPEPTHSGGYLGPSETWGFRGHPAME